MNSHMTSTVPDEATLFEVAQQACAQHLKLLTNGKHTVLSPINIPGYRPLIFKVKRQGRKAA